MNRLLRALTRVFALLVVATTLFGMGSAAVAAVTKRRLETTKDPASNEPTAASVFAGDRFESHAPALRHGLVVTGLIVDAPAPASEMEASTADAPLSP